MEIKTIKRVELTALDYQTLPDEELARLVAGGEAKALETLYDRYSRQAIGLAYRITGQAELAEEVAHEAFLKFWERPDMFQPGRSRFVTWLLSVVHHRAINERRRSSFRLNVSADRPVADGSSEGAEGATLLGVLSDEGPEPHELVWAQVQREAVRQALEQLSYPQRRVIEMAYFKGLNQREIAQELGEPLGTIKTRIRLGMQKLRAILDAQGLGNSTEVLAADGEMI